jgi:exodeoxyribonuclease VII large subunit
MLDLHGLTEKLRALSPLATLERGFAVVQNQKGAVIRSVAEISSGSQLLIRLPDGAVVAKAVAVTGSAVKTADVSGK